jgi:hypothetical protein
MNGGRLILEPAQGFTYSTDEGWKAKLNAEMDECFEALEAAQAKTQNADAETMTMHKLHCKIRWLLHSSISVDVSAWLFQHGCVSMVASAWLLQHGCFSLAVSAWLFHHSCFSMVDSEWLLQQRQCIVY